MTVPFIEVLGNVITIVSLLKRTYKNSLAFIGKTTTPLHLKLTFQLHT